MNLLRSIRLMVLAAAAAAGLASTAAAQVPNGTTFQYFFADSTGTEITANSLTVAPGSNFTLQAYIRQTAGDASFLTSENGLFGAGVRATYGPGTLASGQNNPSPANPGGVSGIISVTSTSNVITTSNPGFNDTATSNAGRRANSDFAEMANVSDLSAPVQFTPVGGVGAKLLVGSFVFTAGSVTGTTNLRYETIPQLSDTVTYNNFRELDPAISSKSLTIVVGAVPEPSSLLALAGLGLVAARRLRRA